MNAQSEPTTKQHSQDISYQLVDLIHHKMMTYLLHYVSCVISFQGSTVFESILLTEQNKNHNPSKIGNTGQPRNYQTRSKCKSYLG